MIKIKLKLYKTDQNPIKIPVTNTEYINCKYLRITEEFTFWFLTLKNNAYSVKYFLQIHEKTGYDAK